ncbi:MULTISPECIES: crotonase/enoyl-CoA hydratase family protein [Caulobacter]|uniref:crotonase/enoyl-CoA hydratase family protein n=1 Tax=Caulobacter TaxID=75 RepID=UPI0006FB9840|nr:MULTISPECIES: crotonase/enoyl-CoA hydratase family protein [Caulobacter]KQZ30869.1 enoyl-CoA hydratase [Caulobacter sp. Root1472]GGL19898.1 enoyl-CoA hydratase [Caulobacter rhizosphaerae]
MPDKPDYSCFDVEIETGVAHLRLKRPEALNTMTRAFWNELPAIVRDIDDNARARCIVISSTGKHFCAGMDLSVFTDGEGVTGGEPADRFVAAESFRRHVHHLQDTFSCLDEARMPVIAAIQGGCIGGAVDFTSACDIRYASADAFFTIHEINIGMTADVGTFPRLCKLIPEGWVRELAYTGRRLPAARARDLGLVNEVFATHEEVVAHALATAREIASKSPLAVAGSKVMINYARDHSIRDALDYIATWQTGMFSPPHMMEAFQAKAQNREPVYPDLVPLRKRM